MLLGLWLDAVVGGHNKHGVVSLARARNHVFHEVAVARRVHDGEVVLVSVELLVSNIDRDTALALFLQAVHHVGELKTAFALFFCLFFVLFDDVLRNVFGLVQESSDQCAFSVVYVADNGQVLVC